MDQIDHLLEQLEPAWSDSPGVGGEDCLDQFLSA